MNRRRFLSIVAAGSAAGLTGLCREGFAAQATVWKGIALNAPAKIIVDQDPAKARKLVSSVTDEIARLENLFSLYRRDSAISRLNLEGRLEHPDPDFLSLLSFCDRIHSASGGVFDPTVQPVWAALAEKYKGNHVEAAITAKPVGWSEVRYSPQEVAFARSGMAITLNGIAQGYITDRIAAILRHAGLNHILVDMGETRSVGPRADGSAWPVAIRKAHGEGVQMRLRLGSDRALAISDSRATVFDPEGRVSHIIDPNYEEPVRHDRMVVVEAPNAVLADGISTALCVCGEAGTPGIARAFPGMDITAQFMAT